MFFLKRKLHENSIKFVQNLSIQGGCGQVGLTPTTCLPSEIQLPSFLPSFFFQGSYLEGPFPSQYGYKVVPIKTAGCECGENSPVNIIDLNLGRTFIIGSAVGTGLQIVTGDYNGDGFFSTLDLVNIDRCGLGLEPIGTVSGTWGFISMLPPTIGSNGPGISLPWPSISPTPVWPSTHNILSLTNNLPNADFVGFRRGDIDQSCSDCGTNFAAPPTDRSINAVQYFTIDPTVAQVGTETIIPIKAKTLKGLSVLGLDFNFDPGLVEILSVDPVQLDKEYFLHNTVQNTLKCSWFTMQKGGIDIADEEVLFNIKVRAIQDIDSKTTIFSQGLNATKNLVFYENGAKSAQFLMDQEAQIPGFSAKLLGANPVDESSAIMVNMSNTGTLQMTLVNAWGQTISEPNNSILQKGINMVSIPSIPPVSGIYYLHCASAEGSQIIRLVHH